MILKLKDGDVTIELFNDIAPKHVERFKKLTNEKKFDGVVFHRVIDGFMAQTGDVKYGNSKSPEFNLQLAGPHNGLIWLFKFKIWTIAELPGNFLISIIESTKLVVLGISLKVLGLIVLLV